MRTTSPPSPPPSRPASAREGGRPEPAARTLRFQGPVNHLVRAFLCTPVLCRALGRRLVTVYVTGRTTGRRYAVPVAYERLDARLLVGSQFRWIRNLRSGEVVEIRLVGKRRAADVRVLSEEADVLEHLAVMARGNHQFAKFNRIGFDTGGEPIDGDLRRAWAVGARVAELAPR